MLSGTCHCGQAAWTLEGDAGRVTVCNCTLCRRYGTIWAYDWENERVRLTGTFASYTRADLNQPCLAILFCPRCACVQAWRDLDVDPDGRRRMAVNVRLASPEAVAGLPIDHFDGLTTFEDQPDDGRCVRDCWS